MSGASFIMKCYLFQKYLSEVFYVNFCSWQCCNTHKKTSVLGSLFNKVAGLGLQLFYEISTQVFPCEYCEIFNNSYFKEHLRTAASAVWSESQRELCIEFVSKSLAGSTAGSKRKDLYPGWKTVTLPVHPKVFLMNEFK